MDKANREKLRNLPVAVAMGEANARLLFSTFECTQEVKLNIEWQMAILSKKINMDFTDRIASLAALHGVEIFKFCNKHQSLLAKHLGLVRKKVPKEELRLRIDVI